MTRAVAAGTSEPTTRVRSTENLQSISSSIVDHPRLRLR
jgi:hypothetical protein